ncbi:MAG: hypothetical protein P4L50_00500 [Anaerolineaceae bacterium]|nr:hypothetical protein [Anaerolineaceae bacterium]
MKAVGLIAAMPQEIAPFLRRVGPYQLVKLAAFTAYRFRLFDLDCILIRSGVGLERARSASQVLIQALRPDLLVSFGIAGAVRPGLQVGDVVTAAQVCPLEDASSPECYLPLVQLPEAVYQAVAQSLRSLRAGFTIGTVLTTRGSQVLPPLPEQAVNPLLDMETAAIAQVAHNEGALPLLSLRSVSDSLDQPLPFDLAKFYDSQQNLRMARLAAALILQPSLFAKTIRFNQNARLACENLAVALFELLKHTGLLDTSRPTR